MVVAITKMEWICKHTVHNSILLEVFHHKWLPNMEWWVVNNNSIFRCKDLLCKQYLIFFPKNYPIPTFFLIIVIHLCLNNQVRFLMMHRWWAHSRISTVIKCTLLLIKTMFINSLLLKSSLPYHNPQQEHSDYWNNLKCLAQQEMQLHKIQPRIIFPII